MNDLRHYRNHILPICFVIITAARAGAQQDTALTKTVDTTVAAASLQASEQPPQNTTYQLTPSLGFTFQSQSKDGSETELLQWLAQLQAKYSYEGQPYQFNSTLFAQYGANVSPYFHPQKAQDNLQLSLVPSMTLSGKLGLRLFFEITGETEMGPGIVDSQMTKFLDPLFLYETLFLGHKTHTVSKDGNTEFEFVAGVGYAYQQTVTNSFVLQGNRQFVIDQSNPLSHVQDQFTLEQGYSLILECAYSTKIGDDLTFRASDKSVALTKADFTQNIKNSRAGSLLLAGFQYTFLSIDYTMHVLYDHNISPRRELQQTMVFGLKVDL